MLAPDLFQRRFDALMNIGRARLPAIAPAWTDQNAHDPGIMLMELLAFTAEAQLYALSRMRRDERAAYAKLLGIVPTGTTGAEGILWSDGRDPSSPAATFSKNIVVRDDDPINVVGVETPTFRTTRTLLWVPGRIVTLESRLADGTVVNHTVANDRGGPAFLPFGERAGRRDVLALTFACRDDAGLFGATRGDAKGALWAFGVRAAPPLGAAGAGGSAAPPLPRPAARPALSATYVAGTDRVPLDVVEDTSEGLLSTGAFWLDVGPVPRAAQQITIELRAPHGFPRPPRFLHIEPSVIPIRQGSFVVDELHTVTSQPDWTFQLNRPGLRFGAGQDPIQVQVAGSAGLETWVRRDSFAESGPDDEVYTLDPDAGQVTFGNGVNGKLPPLEAQVLVSYAVSDAEQGNVARNRRWQVAAIDGVFGVNPEPVTGGAAAPDLMAQRRDARELILDEHPLVSAADLVAAALELSVLEVGRAWVVPPDEDTPRTGAVTLVAMRSRTGDVEPANVTETSRWLAAVRRRLVSRIPLGTRLLVAAPRYVSFSLAAALETEPGRDPATIEASAWKMLRGRLALVASTAGAPVRPEGVPLSRRDLRAWLRTVDGVRRVTSLQLLDAGGTDRPEITVPPSGLPRWNSGASQIEANRP